METQEIERPVLVTAGDVNLALTLEQLAGRGVVPVAVAVVTDKDGNQEIRISGNASDDQARFFHAEPVLVTGLVWNGLGVTERIHLAQDAELDADVVMEGDVFDVLPMETLDFVAFWAKQVCSGECWHGPGSLGARAADLLEKGFLLHSKRKITDYYGQELPTRYNEVQGRPGTDSYVKAMMGDKYLAWLKTLD